MKKLILIIVNYMNYWRDIYYKMKNKEEMKTLKKGCGRKFIVHGDTYSCGKDTIMLCPKCKKKEEELKNEN